MVAVDSSIKLAPAKRYRRKGASGISLGDEAQAGCLSQY
jgi:hypothetical protein